MSPDIRTNFFGSLFGCPVIRDTKTISNYFLHDFTNVFIDVVAITVIALWIYSALNELVLTIVEHISVDFILEEEFVSVITCRYGIEYHSYLVEHVADCA